MYRQKLILSGKPYTLLYCFSLLMNSTQLRRRPPQPVKNNLHLPRTVEVAVLLSYLFCIRLEPSLKREPGYAIQSRQLFVGVGSDADFARLVHNLNGISITIVDWRIGIQLYAPSLSPLSKIGGAVYTTR